jgi:hypothetical protein
VANLTWKGGTGDWFNAANWNPAQVPQPGDTATIAGGTARLLSNPADGVTLDLGAAGELSTTNVTFGPNFKIFDNTSGEDEIQITGTVVNEGTISLVPATLGSTEMGILGTSGSVDAFVNEGNIDVNGAAVFIAFTNFSNAGQINLHNFAILQTHQADDTGSFNLSTTARFETFGDIGSGQRVNFLDGSQDQLSMYPSQFHATISGFRQGNQIILMAAIGPPDAPVADSEAYDPTTHVLSLFLQGQQAGSLIIAGPFSYTTQSFKISNNVITTNVVSNVGGSALALLPAGMSASSINVVLTQDGTHVPAPVAGKFNVEVFTGTVGPLTPGYAASVFIPGSNSFSSNVIQTGTLGATAQLLDGSYLAVDEFGRQSIQVVGAAGGGSSISVVGSSGDTITGSTVAGTSQLIDARGSNVLVTPGPMTIIGGAGATIVWAGTGDGITGAAGAMTVDGARGGNTITGGTGNLVVVGATVSGAAGDSITGAQGSNRTSYIAAGVGDTVIGGGGNTTVAGNFGSADSITGGTGAMTVYGSANDTITGGPGALQVNDAVFAGAETVVGGAGSLTVFSIGKNFSITGSSGGTTFVDDSYGNGGNTKITGGNGTMTGAGGLAVNTVIIGAAGDTITGGGGTTYINGILGSQSITAGSGATTVQAATGDTVTGGSGPLQVFLESNQASTTVNLGAGHGTTSLRESSVVGGKGSAVSVTGFATVSDIVQSSTSVLAGKFLGSSASDGKGGTILTFLDGTTMSLAGISDPSKITFAS